jgi:hypothetical protein
MALRFHLIPFRLAITKKTTNTGEDGVSGKGTLLIYCWWEGKLVQPLWKSVWSFLKKLKLGPPYDPIIPLLGIYLKVYKSIY